MARQLIIGDSEPIEIPETMTQAEAVEYGSSINPDFAQGQIRVGRVGETEQWSLDRVAGSKGL